MQTITIEISDTQFKGLEFALASPQEWIENAAVARATVANDKIVNLTVQHCLDNGIQIPATREEIIAYAFDNGVVKTAAVRNAEFEASQTTEETSEEPVES